MEIQNLSLVDNVRTALIYFTLQLEGVRDQGGLNGLKKTLHGDPMWHAMGK
jgi:hypothetical protein